MYIGKATTPIPCTAPTQRGAHCPAINRYVLHGITQSWTRGQHCSVCAPARVGASNNIGVGVMKLSLPFQAEMDSLNIGSWAEPQKLSILWKKRYSKIS